MTDLGRTAIQPGHFGDCEGTPAMATVGPDPRARSQTNACRPWRGRSGSRFAVRPIDGSAGFHLWSPELGIDAYGCQQYGDGHRWQDAELTKPVPAEWVPNDQRCGSWLAPRHMPIPARHQKVPLPKRWPEARMPRWYAWWYLYGVQDGDCATCDDAAYAIDHDHATGVVRGLLCISCNRREGLCALRMQDGTHNGPACFAGYWENPPAKHLGWLYTPTSIWRA